MGKFSDLSISHLKTCDQRLQDLFNEVVKTYDCAVLCGHRTAEEQAEAFRNHRSKMLFPYSRHNTLPSKAVDVVPWPIEWPNSGMDQMTFAKSMGRFYMFVGYVRAKAEEMGIRLRCGADWNGNFEIKDQNFDDLPHFEIIDPDMEVSIG